LARLHNRLAKAFDRLSKALEFLGNRILRNVTVRERAEVDGCGFLKDAPTERVPRNHIECEGTPFILSAEKLMADPEQEDDAAPGCQALNLLIECRETADTSIAVHTRSLVKVRPEAQRKSFRRGPARIFNRQV
jgi:hypothetical protein